jgi:cytoskeletal protein RodZ
MLCKPFNSGYNESMRKYIIIGVVFLILLAAVFFCYSVFSRKKTININNSQQTTDSMQETEVSDQESEDSTQNAEDSKQQTEDSTQNSADNTQNTTDNKQEEKKVVEEKKSSNEKIEEKSSAGEIVSKFVSWGFEKSSNRKIDTIIVHSSYDALGDDPYDVAGLIAEYKQYGVAAHYLIDREGTIYQLVADKNIAYHAGESKVPDGRTGVNTFSIGIEMMNTKEEKFTSSQYSALNQLLASLNKQYSIKYILGHKDVSPGRKTDPWGMDWNKVNK